MYKIFPLPAGYCLKEILKGAKGILKVSSTAYNHLLLKFFRSIDRGHLNNIRF